MKIKLRNMFEEVEEIDLDNINMIRYWTSVWTRIYFKRNDRIGFFYVEYETLKKAIEDNKFHNKMEIVTSED